MRTANKVTAVILTGFSLFTAGCGNSGNNDTPQGAAPATTTTSSTAAGDDRRVKFANDVCGAAAKFVNEAKQFKPDTSGPAAAVTSMRTQLGELSGGLAAAIKDLDAVETGGVPDGQTAVNQLKQTFGQMKDTVDRSKSKMDAVDPNNTQAAAVAMQDAAKDLSSMGDVQNPLDLPGLKTPEMEAAARKAENCQELQSSTGSSGSADAPSTPTS